MKKANVIILLAGLAVLFTACNKDSANPAYPYSVRMTDAPAVYDEVNIDLQGVVVTGQNGQNVTLNVKQGIYNLLELSNGKDTLIATGTLTDARVEQIRLILGTNNTVVVDGNTYPLSTPSADQSGLKIQVHQDLEAGVQQSVLIDFDASQSIVKTGANTYKLKPVIRKVDAEASGSIRGRITPGGVLAVATAVSNSTSVAYSTSVSADGKFKVVGLPSGIYTLTVTPVFPFSAVTKTNVMVNSGSEIDAGLFNF